MSAIGIYGAGAYGRTFLEAMRKEGVAPDFFIDQFTGRKELEGLPVHRIDDVIDRDARIYVSVALVPLSCDANTDIVGNLRRAGFAHVVGFEESLKTFPEILPGIFDLQYLWMRSRREEMLDQRRLEEVAALLSDDASRELLDRLVAFRREPVPAHYVSPDGQVEYFPDDVELFRGLDAVRFVDCGAYVGDTIAELSTYLARHRIPLEYAVSFEPDPANYGRLTAELARRRGQHPNARLFACPQGVWSKNDMLGFNADNASSSNVVDTAAGGSAERAIQVVSLDDVLGAAAPNFIKMDIEGAEREAILGAQELIRSTSPVLAICVYHKPEDLWDLPLLIAQINPGYRMYLRAHSHMGLSTVLYCVPRSAGA